jgi:hypothetical protein
MGIQYIGTGRIGATQNASYSASAGTVTNKVGSQTYKVRVLVTTDAFVTTDGSVPSATSGAYVPALSPEYFTVTPGQTVSALQVSAAGTLYVTEVS